MTADGAGAARPWRAGGKAVARWRSKLARARYRARGFFAQVRIETATACNRRCAYCPNSRFDRGLIENQQLMDAALFHKVIDDLAAIKYRGVIAPDSFNEPLLDPRLVAFMGYARRQLPGAWLLLVTNGDFLTAARYEELVAAGIDSIIVSIHGKPPSPTVQALAAYLRQHPQRQIPIQFLTFGDETPLYNRGGLVEPLVLNTEPRCISPENPLVVNAAGDVVLCCNDYFGDYVYGNVADASVVEIWHSEAFRTRREQQRRGDFDLAFCRRCVGLDTV
jgi:2-deoxy-scyllo-inosamine dehydrogenase (SAM-dependent)